MSENVWILVPIIVPVLAGMLLLLSRGFKKEAVMRGFLSAIWIMNFFFVIFVSHMNGKQLFLWRITGAITIEFAIDEISLLFASFIAFIWILVGLYSFPYMDGQPNSKRFFGFYTLALGILTGLSFAGSLTTLYVFYELMTLSIFPLVIHEQKKESIMAGLKFLFYSFAGAFMGLFGILFLSHYTTSLTFAPGGTLNLTKVNGNETILLLAVFIMIIGFSTKAGMFPMHGWLPTAHPIAPSPASAIMSGVLTKTGVLCIIRSLYYIVGVDFLKGTWVQYAFMALTLITVFMGSMLAYRERILKKRLAYSTVSQVSYILFGISLFQETAFSGSLLHILFHGTIKITLFLCAGAIICETGLTKVDELKGIGKRMPVVLGCFTLASLALIGIPPASGFISKWLLAAGALDSGIPFFAYAGPVILIISALLTAGYLLPVSVKGFLPGEAVNEEEYRKVTMDKRMTIPIILLTVGAVVFGIFPGGLFAFVSSIADKLM